MFWSNPKSYCLPRLAETLPKRAGRQGISIAIAELISFMRSYYLFGKAPAVNIAQTLFFNRLNMRLGPITLMDLKPIARVFLGKSGHKSIPRNLGGN